METLSVSCIGSNGLKLVDILVGMAEKDPFSILYRIEWVETFHSEAGWRKHEQLSVSCIGSNGLKPDLCSGYSRRRAGLSVSCIGSNGLKLLPPITPPTVAVILSVSCIGSNGLKPAVTSSLVTHVLLSVSCIGSNGLKRYLLISDL